MDLSLDLPKDDRQPPWADISPAGAVLLYIACRFGAVTTNANESLVNHLHFTAIAWSKS